MDGRETAGVFTPRTLARLHELADVRPGVLGAFTGPDADAALASAEVLLTGWGCPRIDGTVLDRAPGLRAILHTAGTVKTFLDREVLARGVRISTAAAANAIPVAEYTLAAIVFGAKRAFALAHGYARTGRKRDLSGVAWLGTHGLTVGVVGASRIGRLVIDRLRTLDADVLVHDPYLDPGEARRLRAEPVGLDELCRRSHVVTLHAPDVPSTRRLIDRRRLGLMRDGTLIVNTARGSLIEEAALLDELASGRLDAVLDVTDPEPLPPRSPLFELPNVLVTPHIAGALGNEQARLGALAVAELARYAAGEPLAYEVLARDWEKIA
ncbi:hydroxyacid dehydrogenase [Bailinhaonella thermotolerans]|uniref:Hydroxyacid dehydrogenase n=2 Tax=Bailinhaonella thermotolerans TaxID=1070861 RepID=A0A3A4B681_9ACTN|nr:hydroxyacid dehydrogenase [Bailinhaonella thermotolerans]